jgi:hypothetical protein
MLLQPWACLLVRLLSKSAVDVEGSMRTRLALYCSLPSLQLLTVVSDDRAAAASGSSSYRTPQHNQRPSARPPAEGEFILTVKDVTSSSEGSFAGHIVHGG